MSGQEQGSQWVQGDVIADKYVVDSVLGEGGMGTVLKALHRDLDEYVAIKMLKADWASERDVLLRFTREARALVKLKGDHIARVYDVGKTDSGIPFMVMEYLEGADLSCMLGHGPNDWQDSVDWIIEACDALGEAHANGIIHRDIKPENLFLVRRHGRARIKLLDFGISKIALASDPDALRVTTRMLGTPLYMSPEQVRASGEVDQRADIWSLGAVLYELLAGHPPFVAEELPSLCALILESRPQPLSEIRDDLPPDLETIVFQCLAKRPEDRYANVAELALDLLPMAHARQHATVEHLTRLLRHAGFEAPTLPSVPPSAEERRSAVTGPGRTRTGFERSAPTLHAARPVPKRKRWLLASLALALFAVAAGAVVLSRQQSPPAPAASVYPERLPLDPTTQVGAQATAAPSSSATPSGEGTPSAMPEAAASVSERLPVAARSEVRPRQRPVVHPRPAPAPAPVPAPAASPSPPSPKLDIRMER